MTQISDDLYLGDAPTLGAGSAAAGRGVGPMGRVYVFDLVPLTKQVDNLGALQQLAGSGAFTLAAGTGSTSVVNGFGETVIRFDCDRAVSFSSTGNISARSFTVTGRDRYGAKLIQTRAGPNNNTVNTLKAFREVISVTSDGAVGTDTSLGTSDIFGFPFAVSDAGYVVSAGWDNTLARNAGTFVKAVATSPSTAAIGDVRGTYVPSSAADGAKRLVMALALPALASGPNATLVGALGVAQYGG